MATNNWHWVIVAAVVVGAATILGVRVRENWALQAEIARLSAGRRDVAQIRREQEALLGGQIAPAELERLRADREALGRLRAEIEALKANAEKMARAPGTRPAAPVAKRAPAMIPADAWKNAGRASPAAAFETALWAAVGGDIDELAGTIGFDPGTRTKVQALFAGLSEEARTKYSSPEKLVALYTAKDIPVSASMRIVTEQRGNENEATLAVLFELEGAATGSELQKNRTVARSRQLKLRRDGSDWKLIVPESAVDKYGAQLAGTSNVGAGAK